ncbi:MAG: CobQ/CobB/MinD/ParA nucleotide binding domain-containing protein [Deltaproteobacteria bacterium]|nr:CobQ/CobB/MinD/ParA nucleotide binding domain-containing protein [Deltaproteobacteria bacterium]
MPPHVSMIIIDSDKASRDAIASIVHPFADTIRIEGSVNDFGEGLKVIHKISANIVILEVTELNRGIEEIQYLLTNHPQLSVIVSSFEKNPEWILKLMRAGAVEYLLRPINQDELIQALTKVGRFWFAKPPTENKQGKIIAVYYPTGGVGVTTVAVNLAAGLATDPAKVALVDLNLLTGDISTFLDVNPSYTLSSVTNNIARLDANFLMGVMTRHSSGPYVLTEPTEVDEAISITPDQVSRLLLFLKGIFDYVVVDCGGQLAGCTMSILENANLILFTSVLSLPAIKTSKRYLAAMERKGIRKDRLKLIVNRYLPKADIQVKDAERVLGYSVFTALPNDYENVIASINKGIPLIRLLPRAPATRAFTNLVELTKKEFE